MPASSCRSFSSRSAISSVRSASLIPWPLAPGSCPPWPGSMTMREIPRPDWREARTRQRRSRADGRCRRIGRHRRWSGARRQGHGRPLLRRGAGGGTAPVAGRRGRWRRRRGRRCTQPGVGRHARGRCHGGLFDGHGRRAFAVDHHPIRVIEREDAVAGDSVEGEHHANRPVRMPARTDLPDDVVRSSEMTLSTSGAAS